jgi:hypothetical protein
LISPPSRAGLTSVAPLYPALTDGANFCRTSGAFPKTARRGLGARRTGCIAPRMFAGHDISCPYESNNNGVRKNADKMPAVRRQRQRRARRIGYIAPRMFAGQGVPCPCDDHVNGNAGGTSCRVNGCITPSKFAGHQPRRTGAHEGNGVRKNAGETQRMPREPEDLPQRTLRRHRGH